MFTQIHYKTLLLASMMSPQNKMSRTDSIWVKVPLKSSPEKYYGFFRNHMGDLVNLFPQYYSSIQLVEGANFSPDCIIQFKYSLGETGGRSLSANVKIKTVDDAKKLLAYNIIEGDVLKHYKVFEVRMEVVNGGTSKGGGGSFAKWSVVFEKANENVAAPEDYLEWFVKICKGVDAYFSKN